MLIDMCMCRTVIQEFKRQIVQKTISLIGNKYYSKTSHNDDRSVRMWFSSPFLFVNWMKVLHLILTD